MHGFRGVAAHMAARFLAVTCLIISRLITYLFRSLLTPWLNFPPPNYARVIIFSNLTVISGVFVKCQTWRLSKGSETLDPNCINVSIFYHGIRTPSCSAMSVFLFFFLRWCIWMTFWICVRSSWWIVITRILLEDSSFLSKVKRNRTVMSQSPARDGSWSVSTL